MPPKKPTCTTNVKTIVDIPSVLPTLDLYGQKNNTRRFLMSDNPESIPTTAFTNGTATLWHDSVSGQTTVYYRVYVWHVNKTGAPMKFGVTIGNAGSSPITVSNLQHCVDITTNYIAHGQCTAAALVGSSLTGDTIIDTSVAAGKVGLIQEWTVPNDQMVGGVLEFQISSSAAMSYKVRTVASTSTSTNLRTIQHSKPANKNSEHPRGSWPFSNITGFANSTFSQNITYDLGSGNKAYSINNDKNDNIMTKENSYDVDNAVATNKGHFGVVYKTPITLRNPTNTNRTVKIYLTGRGGSYGGAVRWNKETTYKVPKLGSNTQGVLIATVEVPKGTSVNHEIYTSTAGSLNTPAAIVCIS
ncbi:hypothetical protein AMS62_06000 [Bacillus sp. FJAT-18019]|nr:hypothetical protein AMS62_06000 [Bacillus sp. FJAT-18019]